MMNNDFSIFIQKVLKFADRQENNNMKLDIEKISSLIFSILHSFCTKRSLEVLSSAKSPEGAILWVRLGL